MKPNSSRLHPSLWPDLAEARCFCTTLQGQQKDREKVIGDYTRVIELKPEMIDTYYFRALNCGAAGRYEEAIRDMKMAAEAAYEPAEKFLEGHGFRLDWH
jgi:tetratricopeptide (TPR) repeat protein